MELCSKCNCPIFLVAHAGPWPAVLGAIFMEKYIVQWLMDSSGSQPTLHSMMTRCFELGVSCMHLGSLSHGSETGIKMSWNIMSSHMMHYILLYTLALPNPRYLSMQQDFHVIQI
jgi:hypothetical protein